MKGIADLHIHSRYSRATSKQGTPEYLDLWARKKGISIVGNRRLYPSGMAERAGRKACSGRGWVLLFKRGFCSGREQRV